MTKPSSIKVSKKYQIAVPAAARQLLHIKTGDHLLVDVQDGIIVLVPRPENYTAMTEGLHHEIWEGVEANKYVAGERHAWTRSPKE